MKPVKIKVWRKFLLAYGLSFYTVEGDHEKWNKPGLPRPVIFPIKDKEIKEHHYSTNLRTMGLTKKQFADWLKINE